MQNDEENPEQASSPVSDGAPEAKAPDTDAPETPTSDAPSIEAAKPAGETAPAAQNRSLLIGGVIAVFALGAIVISIASSAPAPSTGKRAAPVNRTPAGPAFAVGKKIPVVLTLKPQDKGDLYCASKLEVEGKRCAFEASTVPRAKAEDEPTTLIPFSTTDRRQILAAGLWDSPALAPDKLPRDRFSVACSFNVEGKVTSPEIKWGKADWRQTKDDWFAGTLTDCKLKK